MYYICTCTTYVHALHMYTFYFLFPFKFSLTCLLSFLLHLGCSVMSFFDWKIFKTFDLPHRKIEHILTAGTAKYNALTSRNLKDLSFRRRVNVFRRDSHFPEQVQGRSGLLWYLWSVWLARYRRVSNPNQRWQQLHGTHRTTGWMGRRFWRWRNVLANWPTAVKFTSTHTFCCFIFYFSLILTNSLFITTALSLDSKPTTLL